MGMGFINELLLSVGLHMAVWNLQLDSHVIFFFFFLDNEGVRSSIRVPRLIPRVS